MDFFNKLGNNIQNVGKEVSKKTKDLGGVVSLTAQIKESENNLGKVYQALGEKYYQADMEDVKARFSEEATQIQMYLDKIKEDKEQLRILKGLQVCPNCGAEVDSTAAHCQVCGTSLKVVQIEQPQNPQSQAAFCPNCGAELAKGAKFCASCGTKVGE